MDIVAGTVADIRVISSGCAAALRAGDTLQRLARGRTTEEAREIGVPQLARAMGGVDAEDERCVLTAIGALRAAVLDAHVRGTV
ncbi:MAG: hypothetical protein AUH33_01920 [Chloroflexi bacterium 13_1_40CM_68_21]|nr:MAG: hypothetical protein AUH33_01920 [Chloroflexi bacterium 13_1_40CM_68_21]